MISPPFLRLVADDLRQRCGGQFARTLVVFPGKRAGLFLDDYLAQGDAPLWSPRYATITDLFRMLCPLTPADPIETACRIHALYAEVVKNAPAATSAPQVEPLDRFYGWAERLLADFDDIDKALVDARALFVNLGDLREIEAKDFLTERQRDVLRRFFKDFDPERNSYVRDRFLQLWRSMPDVYTRLQAQLEAEGLAYAGMLQRRAVERLERGEARLPDGVERVAVVGFNVLSGVERRLFKLLQKEVETLFYWDYDTYYTAADGDTSAAYNEAGHFMRQNLREFPNALPVEAFSNLLQPKRVAFVSATSDSAQARYVAPWLAENLTPDARRTAIVLCDENLLQPVLHTLPPAVGSINITKGYPLAATDTYASTMRLADTLEQRGAAPAEFLAKLQEALQKTDAAPSSPATSTPADILEQEARFQAYTVLERFAGLVGGGRLAVGTPVLRKLLKQVMRRETVAFHGEPVEGLQVMGLLETRCLDFDSVLLLSADDSHLPRAQADNSLIPYFLREAYGLPTHRENAAVYAYYFHRLLSRCRCATAVWCTGGDGTQGGEMSRFMTQLLLEAPQLQIDRVALQAGSTTYPHPALSIAKPADLPERLASLSPSALNEYLACPVRFYFRRVSGLKAWEEPTEGMAQNHFGTIFHDAAQLLYTDLSRNLTQPVTPAVIGRFLEGNPEPQLLDYIGRAFADAAEQEKNLTGTLSDYPVEREVLLRMLKDLLRTERRLAEINLVGLEDKYFTEVTVELADGSHTVRIGGIVDRLDRVRGKDGREVLRVLDYKTGSHKKEEQFTSVAELFKPGDKRPQYVFQTFLYALAVEGTTTLPIRTALHYTTEAYKPDYYAFIALDGGGKKGKGKANAPDVPTEPDVRPYLPTFRDLLTDLVQQILDPAQPFTAIPTDDNCRYCQFRYICRH
ncbi:MAG: PD-(D/E)XK nuclease family protein [Bacteroidaceae bacterium]|nr:PD-(D/E)XK nuclease family protein [Bacteroidaceae bacterium]